MTTADRSHRLALRKGDTIAIVAGSGRLPIDLAEDLKTRNIPAFVVMLEGEADVSLSAYDHEVLALENFADFIPLLKRRGATHAVFAGGIGRRPRLLRLKPSLALLSMLTRIVVALAKGDDGLLRVIAGMVEASDVKVVGGHEIVPDLLAAEGVMTRVGPTVRDRADVAAAWRAARAIGALDIGQAAVAIGGRAIALEGIEGTEGLLDRTRELRSHGRIAGKTRGVLAKCAKPGQDVRLDLPAIGPATVVQAHAAGLAGIAVEAGRSLVLDFGRVVEEADRLGVFVVGLPSEKSP